MQTISGVYIMQSKDKQWIESAMFTDLNLNIQLINTLKQ